MNIPQGHLFIKCEVILIWSWEIMCDVPQIYYCSHWVKFMYPTCLSVSSLNSLGHTVPMLKKNISVALSFVFTLRHDLSVYTSIFRVTCVHWSLTTRRERFNIRFIRQDYVGAFVSRWVIRNTNSGKFIDMSRVSTTGWIYKQASAFWQGSVLDKRSKANLCIISFEKNFVCNFSLINQQAGRKYARKLFHLKQRLLLSEQCETKRSLD